MDAGIGTRAPLPPNAWPEDDFVPSHLTGSLLTRAELAGMGIMVDMSRGQRYIDQSPENVAQVQ